MEETHKDESFITRKMEEMKRRNEEIRRRHMEIEEDKILADQFSSTVKAQRKEGEKKPATPRPQKTKSSVTERLPATLPKTDGPPPDPNFNFLSDPSRNRTESSDDENWRNSDKNDGDSNKWGQSRRHRNNYGGSDFNNVKPAMQKQKASFKNDLSGTAAKSSDLRMQLQMTGRERIEYEEWKLERDKVDQARIQRQRASDGTWRREWDSHKAVGFNFNAKPPVAPDSEMSNLCKTFKQQRLESRVPLSGIDQLQKPELSNVKTTVNGHNNASNETQNSTDNQRTISQGHGKLSVTVLNNELNQKLEKTQSIVKKEEQNAIEGEKRPKSRKCWTFLTTATTKNVSSIDSALYRLEENVSSHDSTSYLLEDNVSKQGTSQINESDLEARIKSHIYLNDQLLQKVNKLPLFPLPPTDIEVYYSDDEE